LPASGIGLLGERAHRDVAIGIVLTLSLGLGLLFLHFYTAFASQATNVLFGNVLGISLRTVIVLAVLAGVILVALVLDRPAAALRQSASRNSPRQGGCRSTSSRPCS